MAAALASCIFDMWGHTEPPSLARHWLLAALAAAVWPRLSSVRMSAEVDEKAGVIWFNPVDAFLSESLRPLTRELLRDLPGCHSLQTVSNCSCPLPPAPELLGTRPLPSVVVVGAAKAGTSMLVSLMEVCSPPAYVPKVGRAAQLSGESFYWIPELLPIVQDEHLSWRGWQCGDATSFPAAVRRVLSRQACSPQGYRTAVFGNIVNEAFDNGTATSGRRDSVETNATFTVEKTPEYLVWPHVHVALRPFVASGSKIVAMLRHPILRLISAFRHYTIWQSAVVDRNLQVSNFGTTFEEYAFRAMHDPVFREMHIEIVEHLTTGSDLHRMDGVLRAYVKAIYSLCDANTWHVVCALKRGPLTSYYLPQLLSMVRFIGGCPSKWLRVVQTEQLFRKPSLVLRKLWAWIGVKGPVRLDDIIPAKDPRRAMGKLTGGKWHLTTNSSVCGDPQIIGGLHQVYSHLHLILARLVEGLGVSLAPFDVGLWAKPNVAVTNCFSKAG